MHPANLGQNSANFGQTVPPVIRFTVPPVCFREWGYTSG